MPHENSFTHNVVTGDDGSIFVGCFAGNGRRGDLGEPDSCGLGINVYDSLGKCALERNPSAQGVESPNFKDCRRVSIAWKVQLQRGQGAPESPDQAIERLVSRGPDMRMEPEQEEREHAGALAKAVETAAANGLSAGVGARLREILNRHWNVFRCGRRGDPPARVEPLTATFKPEAKVVKVRGCDYSPIKTA